MKGSIKGGLLGLSLLLGLGLGSPCGSDAALTHMRMRPVNLTTYLDGVTAVASEDDGINVAENAIDGKSKTRWDAGTYATEDSPAWFVVDLGGVYEIDKIQLRCGTPGPWKSSYYEISVSNDLTNWEVIQPLQQKPNLKAWASTDPIVAQYVQYEILGGNKTARLGDIRIVGSPQQVKTPIPAGILLLGSGMVLVATLRRSKGATAA